MELESSNFDSLEEQEAVEFLRSIKRVQEQEKKLLTDNAFIYFCLWQSFNKPNSLQKMGSRVKAFPFPHHPA